MHVLVVDVHRYRSLLSVVSFSSIRSAPTVHRSPTPQAYVGRAVARSAEAVMSKGTIIPVSAPPLLPFP